jgi:lipopolysaccharide export system protein LptA
MRFGRWLILGAIFLIVAFVGDTYIKRKARLAKDAPAPPPPLELGLDGRGQNGCFTENTGDRPRVQVCWEKYRQITAPSTMELDGVTLKLYEKEASQFDLVKGASAQFDMNAKTLYSDGDVEITLGVNNQGPPQGRLVKIRSSGVHFSSDNGHVNTDRGATFELDSGAGSATGADYDPDTRQLHLLSHVSLDWWGRDHSTKPMHIEAQEAVYQERESKVTLMGRSQLTRENLTLQGEVATIILDKGDIEHTDIKQAQGTQNDEDRKVDFAADWMSLRFTDPHKGDQGNVIRHIDGEQHARLVSTSDKGRTTVTGDHLELDFQTVNKESVLDKALVQGHSVAESVPAASPPPPGGSGTPPQGTPPQVASGTPPQAASKNSSAPETRILRSDTIRLKMQAGGKEIESAETDGPGTLDFLPNRPDQPKRNVKGDRIWIVYGADNRVQTFRTINVSTRTDKPTQPGKMPPAPAFTQSKEMLATFDPGTGDLARVEQKTDFRYQEGDSQARADSAILDQKNNVMTLTGAARTWDSTGSASADRIVMDQKTGNFTAEGHVASTHQPDSEGKSSAMLATDQLLEARAQRMVSTDHNQKIHYEGRPGEQAVAWQGANRVQADRLDIDREKQKLEAHGKVVSQFIDKKTQDGGPKSGNGPVFTVVRAPDLVYDDNTRLAVYQGGAVMARPGMTVAAREIRAYLNDSDADSSLDKAFAEGGVKIDSSLVKVGQAPRNRTGTSEHAEYYADEGKVILQGGQPLVIDSVKGKTTGKELTWWPDTDKLLVDGEESKPAKSNLNKKKK